MNLGDYRALLERLDVSFGDHVHYGKVVEADGDDGHTHYSELTDEDGNVTDIFVCVELGPQQVPTTVRLGSYAGTGQGDGLWKIPEPGTSVLVITPGGTLDAGPIIVACSSNAQVPEELDQKTMVLKNGDGDIKVVSSGDVTITVGETSVTIAQNGDIDLKTQEGSTVNINGSDYSLLKTEDFLEALSAALTDLLSGTTGGPTNQMLTNTAHIIQLIDAISAGTYKSMSGKNGA
jgi:co-chaperonin GroES (HSP10)